MSAVDEPVPDGRAVPLRPPGPGAAAAAAGLPDAALAEVTPIAASHSVHRVTSPAGSVIVKVPDEEALQAGRSLAPEAFAYRLATWHPGFAAVVPPVLLVDERRQVVVLAASQDHTAGRELLARGSLPHPRAAAALGASLAAIHRDTTGLPIPFHTSTGVLELTRVPPPALLLQRARGLALAVADDPVLSPALTRARRAWHASCLVHGDVKWDNCLVQESPEQTTVLLIDWELCGHGDPAWDLAAALAGSFALELSLGAPAEEERVALATGYWSAGGPADPERVALLCPPRLVQLALECAESAADNQALALLTRARELVHDLDLLETMLVRCARACQPTSVAS